MLAFVSIGAFGPLQVLSHLRELASAEGLEDQLDLAEFALKRITHSVNVLEAGGRSRRRICGHVRPGTQACREHQRTTHTERCRCLLVCLYVFACSAYMLKDARIRSASADLCHLTMGRTLGDFRELANFRASLKEIGLGRFSSDVL